MDWNTLLFAGKWAIIGLIYFALFILLIGVYREMGSRLAMNQPAAAVRYGRLRVIQPGGDPSLKPGTVFDLKDENRLGAGPGNDVVLHDRYISGIHARLRWDGSGWWVEDLSSRNGTYVNRQLIPPGKAQPLPKGGVLEIGDMAFEVIE